MDIATCLGLLFSLGIVIGAMYYLVFTPIGLLFRLMGKDSLRLRFDPNAGSYWIPREPPGSMKNQF